MKKVILSTLGVATLSVVSYAATFLKVYTTEEKPDTYDLETVENVDFKEELVPIDYTYVDLGLPSGTLWAEFNVGATKIDEYGDYFMWGETTPKIVYDWSSYKWLGSSEGEFTKYSSKVDGLTTLLPEDDAATVNWGEYWRTPTVAEFEELEENCEWVWTTVGSAEGIMLTGKNGNTIFFPATGFMDINYFEYGGYKPWNLNHYGHYWSSQLYDDDDSKAHEPYMTSKGYAGDIMFGNTQRYIGHAVRPVRAKTGDEKAQSYSKTYMQINKKDGQIVSYEVKDVIDVEFVDSVIVPEYNPEDTYVLTAKPDYVDLGLPSRRLWAIFNVGATKPEEYGAHFAWGETKPKKNYTETSYEWYDEYNDVYSRYSSLDDVRTFYSKDDAATVNWGSDWRVPTFDEMQELIDNCDWSLEYLNGVYGAKVTGPNGNWMFLPAAGDFYGKSLNHLDAVGYYWQNSLNRGFNPFYMEISKSAQMVSNGDRWRGYSIRPVYNKINTDLDDLDVLADETYETAKLPGRFSVSSTEKVSFSKGNLQYQASTSTWRFAENQYDVIGKDNANKSATYDGWIDLFGWGTSGYNKRYPYATQSSDSYYGVPGSDDEIFYDWGYYNAISNGGNKKGIWRTLTSNEWRYLLSGRINARSLSYQAIVNDVNGWILFPDDWTNPTGLNFKHYEGYDYNVIDKDLWEQLESLGAVFLPSGGECYGSDPAYVGSYGYYWSFTDSNYVFSNSSQIDISYDGVASIGCSVRLVTE